MFAANGVSAVASLAAQLVLAWFLAEEDFGVYALTIGFSSTFLVFKDAGVGLWLSRLSPKSFRHQVADAFWLVTASSSLIALALAAASPVIADLYHEPKVGPILLVVALGVPLGAYPTVALASLQVDHRFTTLARIETSSVLVRYGLMSVFAVMGLGPMSFVLPVIAVNIFQAVTASVATRLTPWRSPFSLTRSRMLLIRSAWPMIGSAMTALSGTVDYLVLGFVASTRVVGIYFFGYQLSVRFASLFNETIRKVSVPMFSALGKHPDRQPATIVRASRLLGVTAPPSLLLITVVAAPLESLLWHGRWAGAVPVIQILSAVLPLQMLMAFMEAIMQSLGKFRLWTAAIAVRTTGLAVVLLMWGLLSDNVGPIGVATAVGLYLLVSSLVEVVFLATRSSFPVGSILTATLPPYFLSVTVAAGVLAVSEQLEAYHDLTRLALTAGMFTVVVVAGNMLFFSTASGDVVTLLRRPRG